MDVDYSIWGRASWVGAFALFPRQVHEGAVLSKHGLEGHCGGGGRAGGLDCLGWQYLWYYDLACVRPRPITRWAYPEQLTPLNFLFTGPKTVAYVTRVWTLIFLATCAWIMKSFIADCKLKVKSNMLLRTLWYYNEASLVILCSRFIYAIFIWMCSVDVFSISCTVW